MEQSLLEEPLLSYHIAQSDRRKLQLPGQLPADIETLLGFKREGTKVRQSFKTGRIRSREVKQIKKDAIQGSI